MTTFKASPTALNVALRYADQQLARRVAERFAEEHVGLTFPDEGALQEYLKTHPRSRGDKHTVKYKHDDTKAPASKEHIEQAARSAKSLIDSLEHMLDVARKGEDHNYVQPMREQMPYKMVDYKTAVEKMYEGVNSIPPGKDRERAKKIVSTLSESFESMNKELGYRWHKPGRTFVPADLIEKTVKVTKPLVHELDKLFTGQRVLLAMEHDSPEALKKYLHEHPDADKSKHSVKKPKKQVDHGPAEAEGAKAQQRFTENKRVFSEMESLKTKVDNADPTAKKKFDRAYDKLFEAGEGAAKSAKKLLEKYHDVAEGSTGDEKEQREAALHLLQSGIHKWENNKIDHHKGKAEYTSAAKKLNQAGNTYGYAQELESLVKDFHKVLKDPNTVLDDSWRK